MYWLLMVSFVSTSVSFLHGMYEDEGGFYVTPSAAEKLSIDLYGDGDGEGNSTSTSPLSYSPIAALTSPPKTFPLTPADPTGTSPLFPSTPSPEELNKLLSPATPAPEQKKLAQGRKRFFRRFGDIKVNISPSNSTVEQEQQQLRNFKRRCCVIGGCLGVSAIAVVFVLIHKYTHAF